jgi:hypothetical protein
MGSYDAVSAGAVVGFNERLAKTDGEMVVGALQAHLAQDRAAWLDDRFLPLAQGSPWLGRAANESRFGEQVSVFQAVEAANIARWRFRPGRPAGSSTASPWASTRGPFDGFEHPPGGRAQP